MSTIKESSDELNPPVVSAINIGPSGQVRTGKDYLALSIATCGVGYLPLAPGTWGSLVGIGFYLLFRALAMKVFFEAGAGRNLNLLHVYYGVIALELVVVFAIALVGTWAASRTEKLSGRKDPGKVVVDEVAGQFIALIPVPFALEYAWWPAVLAFILFRFFDIVKPYPAAQLAPLEEQDQRAAAQQLAGQAAPEDPEVGPHFGSIVVDNDHLHVPQDIMEGGDENTYFGMEPVVIVILGVMLVFIAFITWQITLLPVE